MSLYDVKSEMVARINTIDAFKMLKSLHHLGYQMIFLKVALSVQGPSFSNQSLVCCSVFHG